MFKGNLNNIYIILNIKVKSSIFFLLLLNLRKRKRKRKRSWFQRCDAEHARWATVNQLL
jgi:hypothetical protein